MSENAEWRTMPIRIGRASTVLSGFDFVLVGTIAIGPRTMPYTLPRVMHDKRPRHVGQSRKATRRTLGFPRLWGAWLPRFTRTVGPRQHCGNRRASATCQWDCTPRYSSVLLRTTPYSSVPCHPWKICACSGRRS